MLEAFFSTHKDNGHQPDRRIQNCRKTMNYPLCFQLNIDNISLEVWVWKSDLTAESIDINHLVESCP